MDVKKVQQEKLRQVTIYYDGLYENEWQTIRTEFQNGQEVTILRDQVEAFLRVGKVYQDLIKAQALRDDLLKIFGSTPPVPSSS
ncbi:hypothetical protein MUP77_01645 [Candidatus Bathyarchaeota archaeon]|nr:hypothetical protein [Candidatus Bathyarchaeota archaeon]